MRKKGDLVCVTEDALRDDGMEEHGALWLVVSRVASRSYHNDTHGPVYECISIATQEDWNWYDAELVGSAFKGGNTHVGDYEEDQQNS